MKSKEILNQANEKTNLIDKLNQENAELKKEVEFFTFCLKNWRKGRMFTNKDEKLFRLKSDAFDKL